MCQLRPCRLRDFARQLLIRQSPTAEVLRGEGAFAAITSRPRSVIQAILAPPCSLVTIANFAMMSTAEGYGELVADFEAQGSRLRKPHVMRSKGFPNLIEPKKRRPT